MRFALLGDARSPFPLVREIAARSPHELVCYFGTPQVQSQLAAVAPRARVCRNWEELISETRIDAVIVAGHDDETLRAARLSAEEGRALLIDPSVGRNAAFFYELTLLTADRTVVLFPLFGLRGHPLVRKLHTLLRQRTLGDLQHVQVERGIVPEATLAVAPRASASELEQALLIDVDLLRALVGEYDQVTASRSGTEQSGFSLATATLLGPLAPQAAWTASASSTTESWRLTVVADHGTAILSGDANNGRLNLEVQSANLPPMFESVHADSGPWLLEQFLIADGASRGDAQKLVVDDETGPPVPTWNDLARVVEVLEAFERSVKRRRMIEIHFETPSERGVFKSQMTAAGCSLLALTFLAVVAYLVTTFLVKVAGFKLNLTFQRVLIGLIFLPLALFLAMQLLVFLARPAGSAPGPPPPGT